MCGGCGVSGYGDGSGEDRHHRDVVEEVGLAGACRWSRDF